MSKKNCLFFLILFLSVQSFAQTDWKTYSYKRAGFSIDSPGDFVKQKSFLETDIGRVDTYYYVYQPDQEKGADHYAYVVSYSDYPKGTVHSDSINIVEPLFEATVESSIAAKDAELIYQNPSDYAGFPGWFWMLTLEEAGTVIKNKTILVEDRLYLIQVVTSKDLSLSTTIDDFINSFKLSERQSFEIPPLKFDN